MKPTRLGSLVIIFLLSIQAKAYNIAIADTTLEALDGNFDLLSAPDKGTEVTIEFHQHN